MNQIEFSKKIHENASSYRKRKILEIFKKENPTEMQIELVNRWVEMFGVQV